MIDRSRRITWFWVLALVATLGLGIVLGRWAFLPPQVSPAVTEPATITVSELTVGASVPVAVSARWEQQDFGMGAAAGTLTSLDVENGAIVDEGERLYTVDLRPVFAAVGTVPAFRDMRAGDQGDDVAQLQRFLTNLGFFSGEVTGDFGASTTQAVRAWQRAHNLPDDGVVQAGDLLFTPSLPARVSLVDGVSVGTRLVAGSQILAVLVDHPEFVATVQQIQTLDSSLPIEVMFGDEPVTTVVAEVRPDGMGNTLFILTRANGEPVCGDRCDEVPLNAHQAIYSARQIIAPTVTGPGVPAAGVWFTANGEAYLVRPDGSQIPVTIIGQGQGQVVLTGVELGETVLVANQVNR